MSKILVICFSSINNVAMAIPVIHSLATQYAQHQIMVLSIDTFSPLFENVPDNVIFRGADFRGEHAGLMGLGWLYNDLKEEKFDAVAAFQPTFRSRFLCWRFRLAGIKAAHIKQNRRELQKLIRRKHKIYTEQDSFFQRCAHTLSQIGYPIRLSFLSLFGKNKGNISSLAPLTGEKNQETWIGIAPFATHVGKIYPLSKQEQILKHLSARDHTKNLLIRRREKRNQSIGRMGPTFPQCHLNSRQTNHKYGIGPHEQYGRHAGNGCRQYAPCIISEHPGCVHLGGNASLCRLCRMESVCGKHNTDRPALPSLFLIRRKALL